MSHVVFDAQPAHISASKKTLRPTDTDQEIHHKQASSFIRLNLISDFERITPHPLCTPYNVVIYKYTLTIADHLTNDLKCFDEI